MYQDFRKAPMEVYMCETGMVLEEVRFHLKHLKGWMRERAVPDAAGAVPREKLCLAGAVWRRADHLAVELIPFNSACRRWWVRSPAATAPS